MKILYLQGEIELVHKLVALIEPARQSKELHLTSIRNENAYYCCIAQLLPAISVPLSSAAPIFVVGDSHALSTAWQELTLPSGEKRLTVPKLVTGCKMWHLRPEAYFFPKENFYNIVETSKYLLLDGKAFLTAFSS